MRNWNLKMRRYKILDITLTKFGFFRDIFASFAVYIYMTASLITLFLGFYGYKEYYSLKGIDVRSTDLLYYTLQLFTLNVGPFDWSHNSYVPMLDVARLLAALISSTAVLLLLSTVFSKQLHKLQLWLCFNHTIVCGSGFIGSRFVKRLSGNHEIVFINLDNDNDLSKNTKNSDDIIVYGNPTDVNTLKKVGISRAKYLICALEDDNANAKIAIQASNLTMGRNKDPLTCFVHVFNPELHEIFRVNEFNCKKDSCRLEVCNIFNIGARLLLKKYPLFSEGAQTSSLDYHILIAGLGNMGESVLLRYAREWRLEHKTSGHKLVVTIIDKNAKLKTEALCIRYPSLDVSCEFRSFDAELGLPEYLKYSFIQEIIARPINIAYICFREDIDSLLFSFRLSKGLNDVRTPIVVRINHDAIPVALLNKAKENKRYENINLFRLWEEIGLQDLIESETHELLAKIIHENYVFEQKNKSNKTGAAMKEWNELTEYMKNENRKQADDLISKMSYVACHIDKLKNWNEKQFEFTPYEICRLARIEHERWCQAKLKDGWKPGKPGNDELKIHDNLYPWNELDPQTKLKDINTVKRIPLFLSRVDLEVCRNDNRVELISDALICDENQQDAGNNSACNLIKYDLTGRCTDHALIIESSINQAGFGISGKYHPMEKILEFTESEVLHLAKIYFEKVINKKSIDQNDILSNGGHIHSYSNSEWMQYVEYVSKWPKLLAKNDLSLHRIQDARSMIEEDRKALIEVFTDKDLAHPFGN